MNKIEGPEVCMRLGMRIVIHNWMYNDCREAFFLLGLEILEYGEEFGVFEYDAMVAVEEINYRHCR